MNKLNWRGNLQNGIQVSFSSLINFPSNGEITGIPTATYEFLRRSSSYKDNEQK